MRGIKGVIIKVANFGVGGFLGRWTANFLTFMVSVCVCRFILSLGSCNSCIVMDDNLNILPISSHTANIVPVEPSIGSETKEDAELKKLVDSLQDTQPVGVLMKCCKTLDQVKKTQAVGNGPSRCYFYVCHLCVGLNDFFIMLRRKLCLSLLTQYPKSVWMRPSR
jgi:hypothetical protein